MRFVVRAVCSAAHGLGTMAKPNIAIRALAGNDTARVIVSE